MNIYKYISLISVLLFCACTNLSHKATDGGILESPEPEILKEEKYLGQKELFDFVKNANTLEFTAISKTLFDTLDFNKVIAYDFEGSEEPYPSVINSRNNLYAPIILRQKVVDLNEINFLIDFVNDNKTYGESTAACFNPHLGFVFYKDAEVKYVIDICMDCNYLNSTTEIPATSYKKMTFEDGSQYGLRGFSDYGKSKIIELSKRLELDYGKPDFHK